MLAMATAMPFPLLALSAAPALATTIERVVSAGGIEAWLVHEPAVPLIAVDFAFVGGAVQVVGVRQAPLLCRLDERVVDRVVDPRVTDLLRAVVPPVVAPPAREGGRIGWSLAKTLRSARVWSLVILSAAKDPRQKSPGSGRTSPGGSFGCASG